MALAALFFVWATIAASAKTRSTFEGQDTVSCEPGCQGQCFEGKCLFLPENIDNEDAINTVLQEHHAPTSLAAIQQSNQPPTTGLVATQQSNKPQLIATVANHEAKDLLAQSSNTSNTTANPANAVQHIHARQSKLHGLIAALEQAPLASEDKKKLAELIHELEQEGYSPQKVIAVGDRLQALVEQLKNKTVMVAAKPEASKSYDPSNKFGAKPMLLSHGVERDYHQSSLNPGLRMLPGTTPTQYGSNFGLVHRSPVDWQLAQSYERLKDQFRSALKTENLLLMENKALRKLLVARGTQQRVEAEGSEPQAALLTRTAGSLRQRLTSQAFNLGPINVSLLLMAAILMTLLCRWLVTEGSKEIIVPRLPQIFPHALTEGILRRAGFRYYVLEITELQIGDLPTGGAVHVTVSVDGGEAYTSQVPSHGADGATLTFPDAFKLNVKTKGRHSSCTFEVSDDDLGSGVAKTVIPAPKLLERAHLKYGEYFKFELTPDSRIVVQDGDDAKKPYVAMRIRDVSDEPGRGVAMSSIV